LLVSCRTSRRDISPSRAASTFIGRPNLHVQPLSEGDFT
jgi:hypothetical protein